MLTSSSVRFASEGCVFPTTVLTIYSRMQTQTLEKSWIVRAIQRLLYLPEDGENTKRCPLKKQGTVFSNLFKHN
jgi:hypothetical protein